MVIKIDGTDKEFSLVPGMLKHICVTTLAFQIEMLSIVTLLFFAKMFTFNAFGSVDAIIFLA